MTALLANYWFHAAAAGAVAAAGIDIAAFRSWKSWQDAATYNYGTASFRWIQGALWGMLTAAGFAAIS